MTPRIIATWLESRRIERAIKRRAMIRRANAEAARRGHHTYWKRAGQQCRAMFGEAA